ncbi:MAG: hypothetical protein ABR497_02550 [Kiritimatiellia bacterium]|nr:hypothetical protein [Lentisphaerota bacterium]
MASSYIVLGGFVCLLRDERWYRRLLLVVVVGMTLNCLLGLAQYYNFGDAEIQSVFPAWRRRVSLALALLLVLAGWWVVREDLARRRGAQYLQGVMARARAGLFDEQTLRLLRRSLAHYRRNTRLQEYRALVYFNYRGQDIPLDNLQRIREVEAALRYDPNSPHKLINLGGMSQVIQGALVAAERPERWRQARQLLQQALQFNPRNTAARAALQRLDRLPDEVSATANP